MWELNEQSNSSFCSIGSVWRRDISKGLPWSRPRIGEPNRGQTPRNAFPQRRRPPGPRSWSLPPQVPPWRRRGAGSEPGGRGGQKQKCVLQMNGRNQKRYFQKEKPNRRSPKGNFQKESSKQKFPKGRNRKGVPFFHFPKGASYKMLFCILFWVPCLCVMGSTLPNGWT